jgi:hypothetical protein
LLLCGTASRPLACVPAANACLSYMPLRCNTLMLQVPGAKREGEGSSEAGSSVNSNTDASLGAMSTDNSGNLTAAAATLPASDSGIIAGTAAQPKSGYEAELNSTMSVDSMRTISTESLPHPIAGQHSETKHSSSSSMVVDMPPQPPSPKQLRSVDVDTGMTSDGAGHRGKRMVIHNNPEEVS